MVGWASQRTPFHRHLRFAVRYLLPVVLLCIGAAAIWLIVRYRRKGRGKRLSRLQYTFREQRDELQKQFFNAAAGSGKPRGLAWKECRFHEEVHFASDRATGDLYALVGVTVSFEAIEGGGMEEVEAVGNLRCATAVFTAPRGRWSTDGRVLFNLEPHEALERYGESLQPLASHS